VVCFQTLSLTSGKRDGRLVNPWGTRYACIHSVSHASPLGYFVNPCAASRHQFMLFTFLGSAYHGTKGANLRSDAFD
jgi:hypothetical protein